MSARSGRPPSPKPRDDATSKDSTTVAVNVGPVKPTSSPLTQINHECVCVCVCVALKCRGSNDDDDDDDDDDVEI